MPTTPRRLYLSSRRPSGWNSRWAVHLGHEPAFVMRAVQEVAACDQTATNIPAYTIRRHLLSDGRRIEIEIGTVDDIRADRVRGHRHRYNWSGVRMIWVGNKRGGRQSGSLLEQVKSRNQIQTTVLVDDKTPKRRPGKGAMFIRLRGTPCAPTQAAACNCLEAHVLFHRSATMYLPSNTFHLTRGALPSLRTDALFCLPM